MCFSEKCMRSLPSSSKLKNRRHLIMRSEVSFGGQPMSRSWPVGRIFLRNLGGFSLIEVMIVVAIIGILASVAIPSFQRFAAKAKQAEAKSNLSHLFSAQQTFVGEWQA